MKERDHRRRESPVTAICPLTSLTLSLGLTHTGPPRLQLSQMNSTLTWTVGVEVTSNQTLGGQLGAVTG